MTRPPTTLVAKAEERSPTLRSTAHLSLKGSAATTVASLIANTQTHTVCTIQRSNDTRKRPRRPRMLRARLRQKKTGKRKGSKHAYNYTRAQAAATPLSYVP